MGRTCNDISRWICIIALLSVITGMKFNEILGKWIPLLNLRWWAAAVRNPGSKVFPMMFLLFTSQDLSFFFFFWFTVISRVVNDTRFLCFNTECWLIISQWMLKWLLWLWENTNRCAQGIRLYFWVHFLRDLAFFLLQYKHTISSIRIWYEVHFCIVSHDLKRK